MDPADILEKLRRHLTRHGFSDIEVTPLASGMKAWRTPPDDPFVEAVVQAARDACGKEPLVLPIMNAAGNMGLFGTHFGVPIATSGVRYPDSRIHAPNENVRLDDFVMGIKHVAAIFARLGELG
jgi:acetylornithine deacetylase/succinyl-diaminopimelate desuccinylase-like protein